MPTKKKTTKKTTKKKSINKKSVKKSDNPDITRTFEEGKMIITFKNGKTREVTLEQLETRLANIPTMITKRAENMQKMIDRITERIANESDTDKKARMQTRLVKMQERQTNMPTGQEITDRFQGWVDSINAV